MPASVLCVDDDRHFCQILARALGADGFEVRLAHDGEQALASLETEPADLVLLDVMLPRRDGFEVLETVRGMQGPLGSLPAVFLSGCSGGPAYAERAARLGAHAWLTKPVPLGRLVEVSRKALDLAPPARAAAGGASCDERRILRGQLTQLPFPALLHHLHGLRADGVLRLHEGSKRKAVQLKDGRPLAVRSNLVGECLGNLLVRLGRIEPGALDESLARMRRGEGMQGQILVAMELVCEEELGALLRRQAEEKLFEIFAWRRGEFRFLRDARLAKANTLALDRSPANLVLRGILERTPLELVDAALAARSGCVAAPGESPFYRFQEIDLDAPGRALLAELAQAPPLAELRRRDERTRRILYGLIATDMVELREERPAGAASSHGPPAAAARDAEAGLRAELEQLAQRLRGRDHFDVLDVSREASSEEIHGAYEDAARRTHPDRFRGASEAVQQLAEEVFGLLSRAHETLADPRRRQAYLSERQADARDARELEEGRRALEAEMHFQEGERLLQRRDFAEALARFERAVALFSEEGEYHAYLGWALFLARRADPRAEKQALSHIRRGRKLAPDREKPYLFLGRLHREAGRPQNAEKCFTRVLQINPDCVEAVRELRLIHMRRDKANGRIGRWLRR